MNPTNNTNRLQEMEDLLKELNATRRDFAIKTGEMIHNIDHALLDDNHHLLVAEDEMEHHSASLIRRLTRAADEILVDDEDDEDLK
jgi:hypothetical protein